MFFLIGVAFLALTLNLVFEETAGEALAPGILSLLSFFLANPQFKRLEFFGIKMEKLEKQQQQAEHLIQRLRRIVELYSSEIVLQKVKSGRWQGDSNWSEVWSLYKELAAQHSSLELELDMRDAGLVLRTYLLFDIFMKHHAEIEKPMREIRSEAGRIVNQRYPQADYSNTAFAAEMALISMPRRHQTPFELAKERRLARTLLEEYSLTSETMKRHFNLDFVPAPEVLQLIKRMADLELQQEFEITSDLILLAGG